MTIATACLPWQVAHGQGRTLQQQNNYHLLSAAAPTGSIAQAQVWGRKRSVGSFTAISIIGSPELMIGLGRDGQFLETITSPVVVGMMVGAVYRFRVTHIPDRPGEELFPTLEVIDKTYTEAGREHRFPIPVHLTDEDLHLALNGSLITRVIYLEDAEVADPRSSSSAPLTMDASPNENALRTADVLGRPLAILRIGSRVPTDMQGDLTEFLFGCPPFIPLPAAPSRDALIRNGQMPEYLPVERPEAIYSENPTESFPRQPIGY